MIKPVKGEHEGETKTFVCEHWRNFPPLTAFMDADPETLRAKGQISNELVQRHSVWKKVCGLVKMDLNKCLECQHVRVLQIRPHNAAMLVTLDGKEATPAVDPTTLASISRRNHLIGTTGSVDAKKKLARSRRRRSEP